MPDDPKKPDGVTAAYWAALIAYLTKRRKQRQAEQQPE